MKATTRAVNGTPDHIDEETLDGLLANIEEILPKLYYHQYQQIAALFSPRPGMTDTDAVPFTRTTAEELQQACARKGIKSVVFAWLEEHQMSYSVIVARSDKGLDVAERQARKQARLRRARFDVYR